MDLYGRLGVPLSQKNYIVHAKSPGCSRTSCTTIVIDWDIDYLAFPSYTTVMIRHDSAVNSTQLHDVRN